MAVDIVGSILNGNISLSGAPPLDLFESVERD